MRICLEKFARNTMLVAAGLVSVWGFAAGQSQAEPVRDLNTLALRIAAEEAQLDGLKVQVAHDSQQAQQLRGAQVADLFGESDEEKAEQAARLQQEQAQDASINMLNQRASDLEESLRRLTGQLEQLGHRIDELNDRVTRMQKDFDYKLCSLTAQQMGATGGSGDQGAIPCGSQQTGAADQVQGAPEASGPPVHLAPPPGVLGTLPESMATGATGGDTASPGASANTRSQFDVAMNLLAKAQYDEARAAFRGFADNNPRDDLTPQAIYWIGNIAYVQKDFAGAAHAFAEGLKKFPASARAPDSMLKLGQSLIALNQKKEGCLALDALPSKYPSASQTVLEHARAARREANCR